MELNTNKEFYEQAAKLVEQVNAKVQEVLQGYVDPLLHDEPEAYHTVFVPLFLDLIKDEYINALSSLKEIYEQSYRRFIRALEDLQ